MLITGIGFDLLCLCICFILFHYSFVYQLKLFKNIKKSY